MVMLSELALGRWWGRGWYPTFNPGPIHNIPCLFLWGKEEEQAGGGGGGGGGAGTGRGGGEGGGWRSRQQEQQHVQGS